MAKAKVKFLDTLKQSSDGKYIIILKSQIKYGKDTITELELDEPRAKHVRAMSQNPDMNETLEMVGKLAGQPDSVIDELSLRDVEQVSEFIEAFS